MSVTSRLSLAWIVGSAPLVACEEAEPAKVSPDTAAPEDTGDPAEAPRARWEGDWALDAASAVTWLGEGAGDRFGRTVGPAGDFDGDGQADALLGAYYRSEGYSRNGEAWLLLGPSDGWSADGAPDLSVIGEAEVEFVSRGMAGVSDLSGDGLHDLLIGAPNFGPGRGRAAVFLGGGGSGLRSLSEGDAVFEGTTGLFGAFVAGPGDMDGDGLADALVSAIFESTGGEGAGAVSFVGGEISGEGGSAADLPTLHGEVQDNAGWSSAAAGDVDGDGLADAWVGRPGADDGVGDGGAVALILGAPRVSAALVDAPLTALGVAAADRAGTSVAGGEDVDGSGAPDLLVGAPGAGAGAGEGILVLDPPASGTLTLADAASSWRAEVGGAAAGWCVALPGDLDGDGRSEALIGAFGGEAGLNEGVVALIYGPGLAGARGFAEADARFQGGEVGDFAGWFVAGAGDVDGRGGPDLLIGAQRSDRGGEEAGRTHLIPGAPD